MSWRSERIPAGSHHAVCVARYQREAIWRCVCDIIREVLEQHQEGTAPREAHGDECQEGSPLP